MLNVKAKYCQQMKRAKEARKLQGKLQREKIFEFAIDK